MNGALRALVISFAQNPNGRMGESYWNKND